MTDPKRAESQREDAERGREYQEHGRQIEEAKRVEVEQTRVGDESERELQESARVVSEHSRELADHGHVENSQQLLFELKLLAERVRVMVSHHQTVIERLEKGLNAVSGKAPEEATRETLERENISLTVEN